jgi:membrane protein YqaA with SNARE-associated domain
MMHVYDMVLGAGMDSFAAPRSVVATASALLGQHSNGLVKLFFSLGLFGVFLVSVVDSSFVPLPLPGLTDVMIVLIAAQRAGWVHLVFLLGLATLGSAIGGFVSYQVGQSGGMAFLEKRVPPRIFRRVTQWMEDHAILSVALPAILPPPMPLSAFVLAAGALNMRRRTFMMTFTLSRLGRHAIAVWLGVHYGSAVLGLWAKFSQKWAEPILITLWTGILLSCAFAFYKIYSTSKSVHAQFRQPAS